MRILEATADTWIKRDTSQASTLPAKSKVAVKKGQKIPVNWIQQAGIHWLVELPKPVNGFFNWYVFQPHFKIVEQPPAPGSSSGGINPAGLKLIQSFEGLHRLRSDGKVEAYWDDLGQVWTIGWGTVAGVTRGMVITPQQADELKKQDLKRFEAAVRDLITVSINANQFSALVSFAYNAGIGALASSSTRRFLNQGDYRTAADRLLLWNKSGVPLRPVLGLARRRHAERAMFLGEDWERFIRPGWENLVQI